MKKLLKFASAVFALLALACPVAGCGGDKGGGERKGGYIIPLYDESVEADIIAWGAPAPWKAAQDGMNEIAECGINVIIPWGYDFGTNTASAKQMLARAEIAGLKVIVTDTKLCNNEFEGGKLHLPSDTANIKEYKNSPAFYGVHIVDEPEIGTWPALKAKYQDVNGLFPDKFNFVNINQKVPGFEAQARQYMDLMTPVGLDHLSFDMYGLFGDGTIRDSFFRDRELISAVARDYGVPAMDNIQVNGNTDGMHNGSGYADPGIPGLRWQMAVDMAFGYQKFLYYAYGHPDVRYEKLINSYGEKNMAWYNLQTVTLEFREWDHVYMDFAANCKGTAVIPGSHGKTDWNLASLWRCLGPNDIDGVKSIVSSEYLLMGIFKDGNGNKGFMVTNATNPFEEKTAEFTMELDGGYDGVMIFKNGENDIKDLQNGKLTLSLEPGEGNFLIPLTRAEK